MRRNAARHRGPAPGDRLPARSDARGDARRDRARTTSSSAPTPTATAASARCWPPTATAAAPTSSTSPAPGTASPGHGAPARATERELRTLQCASRGEPDGEEHAPSARREVVRQPTASAERSEARRTARGSGRPPLGRLEAALPRASSAERDRSTASSSASPAGRLELVARAGRTGSPGRCTRARSCSRKRTASAMSSGRIIVVGGDLALHESVIGVSTKPGAQRGDLMPASAELPVHRLREADHARPSSPSRPTASPGRACRRSTRCSPPAPCGARRRPREHRIALAVEEDDERRLTSSCMSSFLVSVSRDRARRCPRRRC